MGMEAWTCSLQVPPLADGTRSFDSRLRTLQDLLQQQQQQQHGANGRHSRLQEAVDRLEQCVVPEDTSRYALLLRLCGNAKALLEGRRVHAHIVRSGRDSTFLANLLVQMYGRCGKLDEARTLFDKIEDRNVFSWGIMMAAYVQNGKDRKALRLFREMDLEGVRPESAIFVSVIGACASLGCLAEGRTLHARFVATGLESYAVAGTQSNVIVETALVDMFGKCQSLEDARAVFDGMCHKNVVSWNAIVSAYAQNGHCKEALELYHTMDKEGIRPDETTFPSILAACTCVEEGKAVHERIRACSFELDVVVGTALVSMYGKCGGLCAARDVFDRMHHRNVVTWCAMISAYAQQAEGREALHLYKRMLLEKMQPTFVGYLSVLEACSCLGDLAEGREIHQHVVAAGFETEVSVGNALINMYGKCGSSADARLVFNNCRRRNVISWNSMIIAYAQLGHAEEALAVFQEMRLDGTKPDEITFLEIIFACSHAGRLAQGLHYFASMVEDHSIKPSADHYKSLVDLLGRAGWIREAEQLVKNMPCKADPVAWTTLIGACIIHGNMEEGASIAERIVGTDPNVQAPYILLSNMYSSTGR